MHIWNELSTGAMMRLVVLTSLDLVFVRIIGRWELLIHPWFLLSIITINLGLYSIMVYSGTLDTTLIGMMLAGLIGTLGAIAYLGSQGNAFSGAQAASIGRLVESLSNRAMKALPGRFQGGKPILLGYYWYVRIGYLVIDAAGIMLILSGGWLARRLRARILRRHDSMRQRPLDGGVATPL